ncbi:MAG: electron transport complex subunit RsxG [Gammaproteobacteria bacterium]|nr:electron transport complex subunit RsxG [Gammaproteobacteria bacterium]
MKNTRQILGSGIILWLFTIIGTGLVAFTFGSTHAQIVENERQAKLALLFEIVPPALFDNDLLAGTQTVAASKLLSTSKASTVYIAKKSDKTSAVIFSPIAPDGYNGKIKLVVGVLRNGTLSGVRVVAHKETPGLGDAIDAIKSDWVLGFNGTSLKQPTLERWKVKRDKGHFDQFTGATITPRAIVKAVKNTLLYYQQHKETLLAHD